MKLTLIVQLAGHGYHVGYDGVGHTLMPSTRFGIWLEVGPW